MRIGRGVVMATLSLASIACEMDLVADRIPMSAAMDELVIEVDNDSFAPVRLAVLDDVVPAGAAVGWATPQRVAAGTSAAVVFSVPTDRGWALVVNPPVDLDLCRRRAGCRVSVVLTSADIPPGSTGSMPFTVQIDPRGEFSTVIAADLGAGWFGD